MPVTVVVDVGNAHVKVCGRTAAGDVARRMRSSSVWAGPGAIRSGEDAEQAAEGAPEHLVVGWVDRLGEEVPFHTEAGTLTAEQLLGEVLEEPLSEVAEELGDTVDRVALLTPDEWSPVRMRRVRAAVEEVLRRASESGSAHRASADADADPAVADAEAAVADAGHAPAVEVLPRAVGLRKSLADDTGGGNDSGGVLVIDVGASAVRAGVLGPAGESSRPVVETGVGGDLLDDRVFRHVLDQVPPALRAQPGTTEACRELARTRRACRTARDRLSSQTETTVPVRLTSAGSDLRLVRPEIESLLDDDLHRILDVGQRAVDAGRAPLSRVVLLGGCAHTPRLAQLASARWSCPVDRPVDPSGFGLVGALDVLERETAPAGERTDSDPVEDATAAATIRAGGPAAATTLEGGPATGRPAAPEWLPGGEGGAHLTSPRRRLQPALLAAASALVLAGAAGVAMAVLPDMDPAGAVTRIVTRTETATVSPDLPGVVVPGPWAPGAAPTVPGTEGAGEEGSSEAAAAAPERFLPGVPALPPSATDQAVAAPGAPGAPGTVADRPGSATRTTSSGTARPGTPGTTSSTGGTASGSTAGGSTTSPTSPGTTAPGTTAPGTTAPGTTAPGTTAPEPTNPGTVEPEPTNPGTVEPEPTNPDPPPADPDPGDTSPTGPGASTTLEPTDPGTPGGDPAPGDDPADPTP